MIPTPALHSRISARQALDVARTFVADYLTDLMGAGIPWRMRSPFGSVWVVPIWIAYPGHSQPETVGSVAVDEATGNIVSWTPVEEALANAEQFHERFADAILKGFRTLGESDLR